MHIEEDSIKNFSGHDSMDNRRNDRLFWSIWISVISVCPRCWKKNLLIRRFLRLTILQNRSFKGQRPLTFRLPELYAAPPEKCSSFIMDFARLQE